MTTAATEGLGSLAGRRPAPKTRSTKPLQDGSRIAVIGAGPAGSMFSYFVLNMAESVGLDLHLDLYEPRQFCHRGPAGCNHCGGVVSESRVQRLATEIRLIRITLNGLRGPVKVRGKVFDKALCPPLGEQMSDLQVAATLTFMRSNRAWGHALSPPFPQPKSKPSAMRLNRATRRGPLRNC